MDGDLQLERVVCCLVTGTFWRLDFRMLKCTEQQTKLYLATLCEDRTTSTVGNSGEGRKS